MKLLQKFGRVSEHWREDQLLWCWDVDFHAANSVVLIRVDRDYTTAKRHYFMML